MDLEAVYKKYPTRLDCMAVIEKVRWPGGIALCPYCRSKKSTLSGGRHHCNRCNTSYSATVGTILQNSKIDLQKWFLAIQISRNEKTTARSLGERLEVTKDTAWFIMKRIKKDIEFLNQIEI